MNFAAVAADAATAAKFKGLEKILQRKLHDSRIERRNHLAKVSAVEVHFRIVLPEAVREIERLRAELHSLRFLETEISGESDIELPSAGTKNRATAHITQRTCG